MQEHSAVCANLQYGNSKNGQLQELQKSLGDQGGNIFFKLSESY